MDQRDRVLRALVAANRILAHEGVLDAWGHVSARHPVDPTRYLIARSRSPELVAADDIYEYALDGTLVGGAKIHPYTERHIHGAIYEARPDVQAVVHSHAVDVLPFGIAQTPLRAVIHSAAAVGDHVPVWDIRDGFGDTDLLVSDMARGRDLARCLASGWIILMRGHGYSAAGRSIREVVRNAIYARINARVLLAALNLGDVTYLSPGEMAIRSAADTKSGRFDRAWEYWCARAGVAAED